MKKNFLQGYSNKKIPALTNWEKNILPQYLVGKKMLQNSMVAGISETNVCRVQYKTVCYPNISMTYTERQMHDGIVVL